MELVIDHVSKAYGGQAVLRDVTVAVGSGVTCLMAPSGAGKTTLLRILLGLERPDSGTVHGLEGRRLAAVFQEDRLPNDFTPYVCVKMTAPHGISKETILSHLAEVGLADCANKPVSQLSGGMRRRVAIIRAVVCNTDTVFFDEPFTGLDRDTKLKTIEYIKRHTQGKTLVFVSHDAEDETLLQARKIRI